MKKRRRIDLDREAQEEHGEEAHVREVVVQQLRDRRYFHSTVRNPS